MREPILKAVAMPPRVFWAPMYPALVNFAMQMGIMWMCIPTFDTNPLIFVFILLCSHFLIVAYSVREPHLSKMMLTFGPMSTPSKNIYPEKGNKLAP